MENVPRSLKVVFADAETTRLSLEGVYDTSSDSYQQSLATAIRGYEESLQLISTLSMFSPNESLEDVSTSDLPYLLTAFCLAELVQKTRSSSPQERKRIVQHARDFYERFLHLLDSYDSLNPAAKKFLEQYADSPITFSTVSTGDPTARRNAKIANFKAEKEFKAKLEYMRSRPEYADFENGVADEEAARAVHLANVEYCTHLAFQALEGLNREWEMLAQAPEPLIPSTTSVAEDERRRAADQGDSVRFSDRLDPPLRRLQSAMNGPLLSRQGKPLQPFTLLNDRQEIARGMFRPGHNLPTMTIDEYLEEERRQGNIIEGGGEASGRIPEPDEDDMEKADAETMKAREWDDFTEENHRGSGNTLNRG